LVWDKKEDMLGDLLQAFNQVEELLEFIWE
jgi:hypothetical protein